jgi:uncharacterized protein
MTDFTPFTSFIGGILIGLSALILMIFHGRIAGISGILSGILPPWATREGLGWRFAFILGLIIAPVLMRVVMDYDIIQTVSNDKSMMILAGLLVGVGTGLGSGCTSGHGVCGTARLSKRSIVANVIFMSAAMITVFILRHLLKGVA